MHNATYIPDSKCVTYEGTGLMGTFLGILLCDVDNKERGLELVDHCLAIINDLERLGSKFRADSEVTHINMAEPLSFVGISMNLGEILNECNRYRILTNGVFDVTGENIPITISNDLQQLTIPSSGLKIDLGGFLKGYALKQILKYLDGEDVRRGMINFGGSSIGGIGQLAPGRDWMLAVNDPFTGRPITTVKLNDATVSISGNTPSHNGHILDPRNNRHVTGNKLSAVIARDPLDAEVLSTVWLVCDKKERADILARFESVIYEFVYNE